MKGSSYNNRPSEYLLIFKRLKCQSCGKTFYDTNPVSMPKQTISRQTITHIIDDLKPYNSTYASVARKYDISTTEVINIFDTYVQIKRHRMPRVLLMDEFYFYRNSDKKYACMIMNFENGLIYSGYYRTQKKGGSYRLFL